MSETTSFNEFKDFDSVYSNSDIVIVLRQVQKFWRRDPEPHSRDTWQYLCISFVGDTKGIILENQEDIKSFLRKMKEYLLKEEVKNNL